MTKLIALFHRLPGSTPEEFREYYENRHAPLASRHYGHLFASYTRNYVARAVDADGPIPDVITEIVFRNEAALREMFAIATARPDVSREIAADEASFMDVGARQMFLCTAQGVSPL
jgi:uncharacterized protein (TIGR02118 family)